MQQVHCLTIAGSDPSGGAGIQGDLKTFAALGVYGMAAVTALTAQNTVEVHDVFVVPADFVQAQIEAVLSDIRCHAAKVGMLANAENAAVVAMALADTGVPVVVDPVILASTGRRLLSESGVEAMRRLLFPIAKVITPNAAEAAVLSGIEVNNIEDAERAARRLHEKGAAHVLVTGGHLQTDNDRVTDILFDGQRIYRFESARIASRHTHGGGCALSASICVGLAREKPVIAAVEFAHEYVNRAIATAGPIGHGSGPVNHLHPLADKTQ